MQRKTLFALALLCAAPPARADILIPAGGASNITIGSTTVTGTAGLLYSDGTYAQSLPGTFYATDPNWSASPGSVFAFGNDQNLALTTDGLYKTAPLTITSTATGSGAGHLFEIYNSVGGQKNVVVYFDAGGDFYSRLAMTVSGTHNGSPPHASITTVGNNAFPYMIGCWEDVIGPCVVSQNGSGYVGEYPYLGLTWDGRATVALDAEQMGLALGNMTIPGGGGGVFTPDTWLTRGYSAATLQIGGMDNVAPVAQTFTASNAPAPITMQAVGGAAGQKNLQWYPIPSSSVSKRVQVGMVVTDTTTSGAIPANTTVASISPGNQTFVLSNNITGSGVQFNDTLVFSTPNTAGSALTIAGGMGTGTGAGGPLNLAYAPAGSSGSSQNALVNLITLNSSGVTIGGGGASTPQLTFLPNSGASVALGSVNDGSGLIIFVGGSQAFGFNGSTLILTSGGRMGFAAGGAVTGADDTALSRLAAGEMALGNGASSDYSGTLKLTSMITAPLTYATLPASPTAGQRAYITDGNSTTYYATVSSGGGSSKISVLYNGSNWIVD